MKIAITTNKPLYESHLDPRFGRCAYFLIVDSETNGWESLENPGMEAMGGAGLQAAQFLSDQGVGAVISGEFGPKAFTALQAAGIRMYKSPGDEIGSIVEKFHSQGLEEVSQATVAQRHNG